MMKSSRTIVYDGIPQNDAEDPKSEPFVSTLNRISVQNERKGLRNSLIVFCIALAFGLALAVALPIVYTRKEVATVVDDNDLSDIDSVDKSLKDNEDIGQDDVIEENVKNQDEGTSNINYDQKNVKDDSNPKENLSKENEREKDEKDADIENGDSTSENSEAHIKEKENSELNNEEYEDGDEKDAINNSDENETKNTNSDKTIKDEEEESSASSDVKLQDPIGKKDNQSPDQETTQTPTTSPEMEKDKTLNVTEPLQEEDFDQQIDDDDDDDSNKESNNITKGEDESENKNQHLMEYMHDENDIHDEKDTSLSNKIKSWINGKTNISGTVAAITAASTVFGVTLLLFGFSCLLRRKKRRNRKVTIKNMVTDLQSPDKVILLNGETSEEEFTN